MNFNTILLRFGLDPDDFINELIEPIKSGNVFIYNIRQKTDFRHCPYCNHDDAYINDYDYVEINSSETDQIKDILRIKKVRFKCKNCNRTFTPKLKGIEPYHKISIQTMNLIIGDFTKQMTFTDIANRYGISLTRVIQIFDEKIPFVPRRRLPTVLCIDEIRFKEEINQNYCCVLYDHDNKTIVDIIKNRQLAYLVEYFEIISKEERDRVKYFISDMYDGYRTIYKRYFNKAIHIIDLFHVVKLLIEAVNSIRYAYIKRNSDQVSYLLNFMKSHWRMFLCRRENILDKYYTPKGTGISYHYTDMVFNCLLLDKNLLESYNILQDLLHYNHNDTFQESLDFIDYISQRLMLTVNDKLVSVEQSYKKWRVEIANGLAKNQTGKVYSNGIAEAINNELKTITKNAYGYHCFDRFRRRALIIQSSKKRP